MPFRPIIFLPLLLASALSSTARADQTGYYDTYVAGNGSDANICSYDAPCATLSRALALTAAGGTVSCFSPPMPSNLNITFSVTLDCTAFAVGSLTIDLPSNDSLQTVHVRGLVFVGANLRNVGVQITAAKTVILENLVLRHYIKQGVLDQRSSPGKLILKDSIIGQNTGAGVVVAGAPGNIATLDNVTLSDNGYGVATASGNSVNIIRSDISSNLVAGVEADGGSLVIVDGSLISHNNVGIASGSAIRLSNNNITFNTTGVSGATGTYGNNRFAGNGSDGTALTPVPGGSTDLGQK